MALYYVDSQILKRDVIRPKLKRLKLQELHDYPPRRIIDIHRIQHASPDATAPKLEVSGLDRTWKLRLPIPNSKSYLQGPNRLHAIHLAGGEFIIMLFIGEYQRQVAVQGIITDQVARRY